MEKKREDKGETENCQLETGGWRDTARDTSRQKWLEPYLWEREVRVREVDCGKVLEGEVEEVSKAKVMESVPVRLPEDSFIRDLASDCGTFRRHYGFLMEPLTHVEENFPIAFTVLAYKQASQVVELLRAIYRPQNWYCLHADLSSSLHFRQAMEAVSGCFPNVFMASRAVDVVWGTYSVVEPDLVCMQDLWSKGSWEYVINLTGQEFPLRTNYELVQILKAYNGANDQKGTHKKSNREKTSSILNPKPFKPGIPGKVIMRYGGREFLGNSLARYKNWVPSMPCPGHKVVRDICILNVLDLPVLHTRPELFANKFYADYSRLALRCLAEDLHNRTREQTLGRLDFNVTFYQQQPFVRNRRWEWYG
ncbi:beta-1,3-galactosyl-O-glycosyl-glycoprotein beta-1,6-N-acetylglucosaminyltransferase-like [Babylonia areolata]|uniref:beta-1,3-galactosyl-O-glycosyl-glycoprotein beta-1,6-N-acetylglucosaminyltransferase-like n=1 Tax=Babylonia areolata TaxID=304850 RepID=UPI003FCFBB32